MPAYNEYNGFFMPLSCVRVFLEFQINDSMAALRQYVKYAKGIQTIQECENNLTNKSQKACLHLLLEQAKLGNVVDEE